MNIITCILLFLYINLTLGQDFPSECEMGRTLAKEHFNSGKSIWGEYDSIQSNNEVVIRAFEKHILDKYQIELTVHEPSYPVMEDIVFSNLEDFEIEEDFTLKNKCYFNELKKMAFEKFGNNFLVQSEQYILNKTDSIIESNKDFYFEISQLDSSDLCDDLNVLKPKFPIRGLDTLSYYCPDLTESLRSNYQDHFIIHVNRNGKIDKITSLREPKACWTNEIGRLILKEEQTMKIGTIEGHAVSYKYYIPIQLRME